MINFDGIPDNPEDFAEMREGVLKDTEWEGEPPSLEQRFKEAMIEGHDMMFGSPVIFRKGLKAIVTTEGVKVFDTTGGGVSYDEVSYDKIMLIRELGYRKAAIAIAIDRYKKGLDKVEKEIKAYLTDPHCKKLYLDKLKNKRTEFITAFTRTRKELNQIK